MAGLRLGRFPRLEDADALSASGSLAARSLVNPHDATHIGQITDAKAGNHVKSCEKVVILVRLRVFWQETQIVSALQRGV